MKRKDLELKQCIKALLWTSSLLALLLLIVQIVDSIIDRTKFDLFLLILNISLLVLLSSLTFIYCKKNKAKIEELQAEKEAMTNEE